MAKKKPIVVYWTTSSFVERQFDVLLADVRLTPVMSSIIHRREEHTKVPPSLTHSTEWFPRGGYHGCTALQNLMKNTYYLNMPFDVDLKLNDEGTIQPFFRSGWFRERGTSMAGAFNVDFLYELLFFSEEPLEMSVTTPYLHQTSLPKYGFLCSVKWDISSWFRSAVFIYQLWPGIRELNIKKGEPFVYLQFHTDRPIHFKQVKLNKTILDISEACARHKFAFPRESLQKLYERFRFNGIRNTLLKEMKNNVVGGKSE
jgi:hypothetical protein